MNKNNIIVFLLALAVAIGAGYYLTKGNNSSTVADEEHQKNEVVEDYEIYPGVVVEKIRMNEDIILLDVRTPEEYEEVHLENALLLPVQELSQQSLASIGLGESAKNKEIIIYCRSGARSKTSYDIMKSLGYTNIKSVAGGMIHWQEDEYPFTETGAYTGPEMMTGKSSAAASGDGPRIVLDRTLHDFGVITQFGGVVEATFTVKNDGNRILTIGDITTSCSCTSAKVVSRFVPVGGETTLTVYFDPDFHEEPLDVFKRTVFIPTNDSTQPEAEVVIQVDIEEGV